jgi:hypothetical protein
MDMSGLVDEDTIVNWTSISLKHIENNHRFFQDGNKGLPPFICHVFTKVDLILASVREQNIHKLRDMQTRGIIGHYLFVSSKTGAGIDELKTALFDCDVDNGNKELEPSAKMDPIKKVSKVRRRIERKKLKKIAQVKTGLQMAKTFTAGFGAKADGGLDDEDDPNEEEEDSHAFSDDENSENDGIQEVQEEDEEVPIDNRA